MNIILKSQNQLKKNNDPETKYQDRVEPDEHEKAYDEHLLAGWNHHEAHDALRQGVDRHNQYDYNMFSKAERRAYDDEEYPNKTHFSNKDSDIANDSSRKAFEATKRTLTKKFINSCDSKIKKHKKLASFHDKMSSYHSKHFKGGRWQIRSEPDTEAAQAHAKAANEHRKMAEMYETIRDTGDIKNFAKTHQKAEKANNLSTRANELSDNIKSKSSKPQNSEED